MTAKLETQTLYTYLLSQSDRGESFALDGLLLVAGPPGEYVVAGDAITEAVGAGLIQPTSTKLPWEPTSLGQRIYAHHQQLEQQQIQAHPAVR